MNSLVERVRLELKESADEKTKQSFDRFFKEKVTCYGVKTGVVGKIAKKYWNEAKSCSKKEVFALYEELYRSGMTEEDFVAAFWLPNMIDKFEPEDMATFKKWIER